MRLALITFALLAMIFGPISGPAAIAHAVSSGTGTYSHDSNPFVERSGQEHDDCMGGFGCCLNINGCRDQSCFSGAIIPPRGANAPRNLAQTSCPALADDAASGQTVAPLLDPPRSTV